MRLLKLLLVVFLCTAAFSPVWAQAAFDDVDAQLQVRQAATAASATASKVEASRKQLEAERQRVVATDGERDLNRATIKALEQELRGAEAKQREQDAALRAAQDARTRGLAAEAGRQKLEEERRRQAVPPSPPPPAPRQAVQPPPAPTPTSPVPTAPMSAPPSEAVVDRQFDDAKAAYDRGDYATAMRLWRPLAEQGRARAQFDLSVMYFKGLGVPQDYAAAVSWLRKAAEQGNAHAQHGLGAMYIRGYGVPQNYVQAHMWFNLAASQGNANAVKNRGIAAAKMTSAQISEAQRLAREWKPKPAR